MTISFCGSYTPQGVTFKSGALPAIADHPMVVCAGCMEILIIFISTDTCSACSKHAQTVHAQASFVPSVSS